MGLTDAFLPKVARILNMTESPLIISKIIQKEAMIKLMKGTVAAAATGY